MARRSSPQYDELIREPRPGGRSRNAITQRIIELAPGDVLDVTPRDGDIAAERSRCLSRLRTATLATGRQYATRVHGGRLYVVCKRLDEQ